MIFALSLLLLFTIAYGAPTGDTDHHVGQFQGIQKAATALSPQGRRFSSRDSPTAMQCVSQCAQQMKQDMDRDVPNANLDKPGEFDPEKLEKICKIHDKTKSCMDQCANSQMKTLMQKMLAMLQYICHDSTYKEHAQCINEVHLQTKATCEGPSKCGPYKAKVKHYEQNKPTSTEQFTELLKNTCQLLKCQLDCIKAALIQKCTEAAFNDMKGLTAKGIELMKYTVDTAGLGATWPPECEDVTA